MVATFKIDPAVKLSDIVSNSSQSRGMGVVANLQQLEIGVFDRIGKGEAFDPLWPSLVEGDDEKKAQAIKRLEDHEKETMELAEGIKEKGQLQPVGLVKVKDGYNVIFGMRRCLARAVNFAKGEGPPTVEAKIFDGKIDEMEARLLALEENSNRKDESPIDRAMTYLWLKKEMGLTNKKIAEKTRQSEMNVGNYLSLLHPKLEDKKWDIHTKRLSVDAAIKLLRVRKGGEEAAESSKVPSDGTKRHRLPGNKKIQKIYDAKKKPRTMDLKEWNLWILPDVRKFIAFQLGLRYSEWKPGKEEPEEKVEGKKPASKAEASPNGEAKKPVVLGVKRERARQLLISLGKTNARTWEDEKLQSSLNKVSDLVEPNTKMESDSLQKLLDRLQVAGTKVKILEDK